MKKLLMILLCVPLIGLGQNVYHEDSVNTPRNGFATLKKDMSKITGKVNHWFSDGNLEGYTNYKNGLKHGEEKIFHDEGHIEFEGSWYEGNPDGIHKTWSRKRPGHLIILCKYTKGKKIGFVSNDEWQAHRTLPLVEKLLSAQCKEVETAPIEAFPIGNDLIDTEELVQAVQSKDVDAIIIGNAA